jgi:hypothetical protein
LPHPPQFALSVAVFTHTLPPSTAHDVWPVPHWLVLVPVHAPATQTCPAAHATLHMPQLAGSTLVWTQLCPHCVVPPLQLSAQAPCEHTCPAAHALPHLPQLSGSFVVLLQTPPHID